MYLKDNKTGKKFKISSLNLIEILIAPVVSLILYGVIVSTLLTTLGFSSDIIYVALAVAYFIDLVLWFAPVASLTQTMSALFIFILWYPIFSQIIKDDCQERCKVGEIEEIVGIYNSIGKKKLLFTNLKLQNSFINHMKH